MNENDIANKTETLILGVDMVEVKKQKAGTVVSIGVGGNLVNDLANGSKKAILLLFDFKEYQKIKNELGIK